MKIAVIGTGIAGNIAAWKLSNDHDITVFEAESRIGGHTNTVNVTEGGQTFSVDTGFIVFNEWTYPNFIQILDELGVQSKNSSMGFSVQNPNAGLEYCASSINALFTQRRNILKPAFYRMIRDILRFNREAPVLLEDESNTSTLAEYLKRKNYSSEFIFDFVMPMGAAIWSSSVTLIQQMPAQFFVRFFKNHGLLSINDRPMWKVIENGSHNYVEALVTNFRNKIRLNSKVVSITRQSAYIGVNVSGQEEEQFDAVFIATHSDQALKLLRDPTQLEWDTLSAIRYQENEAILHTDTSLLPSKRRAWAAWNAHVHSHLQHPVSVTYNMNILQGLPTTKQYMVTLNHCDSIDAKKIIDRYKYSHPVFTPEAVNAQKQHEQINGFDRIYYCGAYWRYGFHEDGVISALNAIKHFQNRH